MKKFNFSLIKNPLVSNLEKKIINKIIYITIQRQERTIILLI